MHRFSLLLALVATVRSVAAFDLLEPSRQPCLLKSFAQMIQDADGRPAGAEVAAFLLVEANRFRLERWPAVADSHREQFTGPIPENVVAVVHTHPAKWDRPSRGDVREAMRIGLPVYVVSRWRVWVVEPASGRQVEVASRQWKRTAERSECATEGVTMAAQR